MNTHYGYFEDRKDKSISMVIFPVSVSLLLLLLLSSSVGYVDCKESDLTKTSPSRDVSHGDQCYGGEGLLGNYMGDFNLKLQLEWPTVEGHGGEGNTPDVVFGGDIVYRDSENKGYDCGFYGQYSTFLTYTNYFYVTIIPEVYANGTYSLEDMWGIRFYRYGQIANISYTTTQGGGGSRKITPHSMYFTYESESLLHYIPESYQIKSLRQLVDYNDFRVMVLGRTTILNAHMGNQQLNTGPSVGGEPQRVSLSGPWFSVGDDIDRVPCTDPLFENVPKDAHPPGMCDHVRTFKIKLSELMSTSDVGYMTDGIHKNQSGGNITKDVESTENNSMGESTNETTLTTYDESKEKATCDELYKFWRHDRTQCLCHQMFAGTTDRLELSCFKESTIDYYLQNGYIQPGSVYLGYSYDCYCRKSPTPIYPSDPSSPKLTPNPEPTPILVPKPVVTEEDNTTLLHLLSELIHAGYGVPSLTPHCGMMLYKSWNEVGKLCFCVEKMPTTGGDGLPSSYHTYCEVIQAVELALELGLGHLMGQVLDDGKHYLDCNCEVREITGKEGTVPGVEEAEEEENSPGEVLARLGYSIEGNIAQCLFDKANFICLCESSHIYPDDDDDDDDLELRYGVKCYEISQTTIDKVILPYSEVAPYINRTHDINNKTLRFLPGSRIFNQDYNCNCDVIKDPKSMEDVEGRDDRTVTILNKNDQPRLEKYLKHLGHEHGDLDRDYCQSMYGATDQGRCQCLVMGCHSKTRCGEYDSSIEVETYCSSQRALDRNTTYITNHGMLVSDWFLPGDCYGGYAYNCDCKRYKRCQCQLTNWRNPDVCTIIFWIAIFFFMALITACCWAMSCRNIRRRHCPRFCCCCCCSVDSDRGYHEPWEEYSTELETIHHRQHAVDDDTPPNTPGIAPFYYSQHLRRNPATGLKDMKYTKNQERKELETGSSLETLAPKNTQGGKGNNFLDLFENTESTLISGEGFKNTDSKNK